ncbi:hypothetical protein M899_0703 [Bacteriovorax sp. BSW11_IV]|uniref:small ribosomal subunit Rsm22 family protein n=1 Tax=Bacteriovorax sp. BSW11_IV TaxID=1353529 RepID=UPI00038A5149|nr:small ribosomal subunit Rsm22 family protein [Bacteriovorax sp. BSW11_IV]EQC49234.1 hypothetical protein M899_0703 [Bacteriovorax sp. BSW11_IV]
MTYSLEELRPLFLNSSIKESELIKKLKLISQNFTSKREKIKEYVLDESLVSAYTAFYLPTNHPKLSFVLDSLSEELKSTLCEYDFYDIGSGPGTYSLAFLDYFNEAFKGEVHVVDSSELMLNQAKKVLDHYHPENRIHYSGIVVPSNKKKAFFFGNSLNEIGFESLKKMLEIHKPDLILFIEPGTSDFFKEAIKIRDYLIDKNFSALYPCMNSGPCPVKKAIEAGNIEWCHQVIRMTHDPSIERLSQLIELDRKIMPMIAHVYGKEEMRHQKVQARLFRFLGETKFSFEWQVCFFQEGENKLAKFEIQKRSLSKSMQKSLKKESVGIGFNFEIDKQLGENHFRVKLIVDEE